VEQRTSQHLGKADHHRDVARALIGQLAPQISQPLPTDWALVAGFYSAVHYVNAYVWETHGYDPGSHPNRTALVGAEPALRTASIAYRRLQDWAYRARYDPGFEPTMQIAENAILRDLEAVRDVARRGLGLPL
jgi:hypothetical protein